MLLYTGRGGPNKQAVITPNIPKCPKWDNIGLGNFKPRKLAM